MKSKQVLPDPFDENRKVAKRDGSIAGNARKDLEAEIGHSVITSKNATELNKAVIEMIESVANIDNKKH